MGIILQKHDIVVPLLDDENVEESEQLHSGEAAEPERLNENDYTIKIKEKMFVEYKLDVLREHIAIMLPLSGIEYNGDLMIVLKGSKLIKIDEVAGANKICKVCVQYCRYELQQGVSAISIPTDLLHQYQPVVFLPLLKWDGTSISSDLEKSLYAVQRYDWRWRFNEEFQYIGFSNSS